MDNKSYVGMIACPICHKEYEIVLNAKLENTFDRIMINPGEVCPECREKYLKEGVMIINPETGSLVILRDEAFHRVFSGTEMPPKRIAFASEVMIKFLNGTITIEELRNDERK